MKFCIRCLMPAVDASAAASAIVAGWCKVSQTRSGVHAVKPRGRPLRARHLRRIPATHKPGMVWARRRVMGHYQAGSVSCRYAFVLRNRSLMSSHQFGANSRLGFGDVQTSRPLAITMLFFAPIRTDLHSNEVSAKQNTALIMCKNFVGYSVVQFCKRWHHLRAPPGLRAQARLRGLRTRKR